MVGFARFTHKYETNLNKMHLCMNNLAFETTCSSEIEKMDKIPYTNDHSFVA